MTALPSLCPFLQQRVRTTAQRLIYAESIWTEQGALDLLATHISDQELGRVFLNDPHAMHQDVLAEGGSLPSNAFRIEDCHTN